MPPSATYPKEKKATVRANAAAKRKLAVANRNARIILKAKAIELYQQGWRQARISDEIQISAERISRWLREAGVTRPQGKEDHDVAMACLKAEEEAALATVDTSVMFAERDEEVETALAVAQNQASPADQYQAYVVATGIRLMRDSMKNVRGPRTVRELSELDQLIRRNLGLNPKGGGGSGGLTIDISILNDTKPTRNGVVVVEAEEVEDDE
jgi:hypothetical protein